MTISQLTFDTPLGPMHAFASRQGIRAILFDGSDPRRNGVDDEVEPAPRDPMLRACAAQLTEYFAGRRRTFDLPLDPIGTPFQLAAWRALRAIPYGETRSYGEQAKAIARPTAVRAIGAANGRNPHTIVVPCHRVLGADLSLTGFAAGVERKRALLELEGALPIDEGRQTRLPFPARSQQA